MPRRVTVQVIDAHDDPVPGLRVRLAQTGQLLPDVVAPETSHRALLEAHGGSRPGHVEAPAGLPCPYRPLIPGPGFQTFT
ncbi:hypothetical protein COSO111634_30150 [Corallococcus soli]